MRILADPNIPAVQETFSEFGEVHLKPGRTWLAEDVRQADVVLVRSVTRVNRSLLEHSGVKFVGSATAGIDHIDTVYLADQGIHFSHAPGSNAESVVEYVLSALFALLEQTGEDLRSKTVGIIGVGQVGSRLARRLTSLGVGCLLNDPPREAAGTAENFVSLQAALAADIISLHVPMIVDGPYCTRNLINAECLSRLCPGSILINSARGGVVDEAALLEKIRIDDLRAVIDCWENEPQINLELLRSAQLTTPHIAGYSLDGKLRATRMLYQSLCDYLGRTPKSGLAVPENGMQINTVLSAVSLQSQLADLVMGCYDVRLDSQQMQAMLFMQAAERKDYFDNLRKNYPPRREFSSVTLTGSGMSSEIISLCREIGFKISE